MTEIGRVIPHKVTHQDGGVDEISLAGLAGQQIFVPYNGKIADITHADTNKHTLNLATALSETRKIIAVQCYNTRISGTGSLLIYPNEGTNGMQIVTAYSYGQIIISPGTNRLQYALTVANDDHDLFCIGYVVEA